MSSSELSCAAAAAAEIWIGCHTLAYCLVELTPIALPPPRKWPVEAHILDLHTGRRGLNHIDSGVDHQGVHLVHAPAALPAEEEAVGENVVDELELCDQEPLRDVGRGARPCGGRVQTDERVLYAVPSILPGFDLNPIKSSRK